MGMLQLIEVLMDVALGNKSITEHAQTITGLFTDCHLKPLADRFTNYLQETAHDPEPAASEHVTVVWSPPGIVDMIQPGVALTLRAQRAASGEIVLNRELSQRVKALMDASVAYDAVRRARGSA
jgi:hypothetical protein